MSAAESRDQLTTVGALADPSRRALYDFVAGERGWVSREQAADALGIQRGIAAHHLDRLADDGLLEVDYRRLTGRRGPGAGRPAKIYRRAAEELSVTLPPRRYELAGRLLAEAADRSRRDGVPINDALDDAAREQGRVLGDASRSGLGRRRGRVRRERFLETLRTLGFEPETLDDGVTVLHNCPFHHLARAHTELVCGMNHCMLDSMLTEIDGTGLRAELEPEEGYCCIRFHPT